VAKQTVKAPKAETPDAVKAKPKTTALVAQMPNAKAISADAGLTALKMIAQAAVNKAQIEQLRSETKELVGGDGSSRGKAQVVLAMAIYNAGLNDQALRADLPKVWLKRETNRQEVDYIYKRLKMTVGVMRGDGVEIDEAREIYGDVTGDTEAARKRKESIRTNFQIMLNKSAKVALHALDNGVTLDVDKPTGFLRLTDSRKSDAVKKHFGMASVLLNEDQNQKILDKKGQVVDTKPVKVKPSFTEVMREAGTAYGVKVEARTDSRTKAVSNDEHIVRLSGDLQTAITKFPGEVPDNVRKALEALQNAIVKRLS
jgi:hypothetical protein